MHHGTALQLAWADGDGFEIADPERDDDTIADEILAAVGAMGEQPWTPIAKGIGGKAERLRAIQDTYCSPRAASSTREPICG